MSTVPQLRDDATTQAVLADWLSARSPGRARVEVSALRRPEGAGGSNETLLAQTRTAGRADTTAVVLRIAPTVMQVFLEPRFAEQYRVLEILDRDGSVPVPRMLGYEPDPALLGAPFWVMQEVAGRAPSDFPPYNGSGFLYEASPEERHRIWRSGVEALAAIHRLPVEPFAFLDDPARGEGGLRQLLQYWLDSLEWASVPSGDHVLEQTGAWLCDRFPADPVAGLSWGDSRFGNMLFDGERCAAVLDWEMVSLGGPLVDLAWWLLLDDALSVDVGLARLEGLGSRADTMRLWQERTGIEVPDLTWYEAFARFRLGVILLRAAHIRRALGAPVPGSGEFGCLTDLTDRLAQSLDLTPTA